MNIKISFNTPHNYNSSSFVWKT